MLVKIGEAKSNPPSTNECFLNHQWLVYDTLPTWPKHAKTICPPQTNSYQVGCIAQVEIDQVYGIPVGMPVWWSRLPWQIEEVEKTCAALLFFYQESSGEAMEAMAKKDGLNEEIAMETMAELLSSKLTYK